MEPQPSNPQESAPDSSRAEVQPDQVPVLDSTSENESTGFQQANEADIQLAPAYSWEASEFVYHEKSAMWYFGLAGAAAALCTGLAFFKQWLGIAMVAVMVLAVITMSRKQPRTLQYTIDEQGISIDGKLHPYELFKSYSLHPQVGWREIDFEPARRFSQRITVLCEEEAFEPIEDVLIQQLPRVDREHDFVEKLGRYLKF